MKKVTLSTKKTSVSKSKTTTFSSSLGGTTSTSSGGGTSGGGGGGNGGGGDDDGGNGGGGSNNTDLNYRPARHFYVVPSPAVNDNSNNADTKIVAPYRTYLGQVGPFVGPDGKVANDIDQKFYNNSEGFAEVVGVVPLSIKYDDPGIQPIYSGKGIFKVLKGIKYKYLQFGHKEITIEYSNFAEDGMLCIIKFNVLFSDGSVITVEQPIVSNLLTKPLGIRPVFSDGAPLPKNLENGGGLGFLATADSSSNTDDEDDGKVNTSGNTAFAFVSAGSWITGNFKGGDNFTPKKHEWWKVSKGGRIQPTALGAVFHQQAYEVYTTADAPASGFGSSYMFNNITNFNWSRRYNTTVSSSFARCTGSDSFEGSAANIAVGSAFYPERLTKYKLDGSYDNYTFKQPQWKTVNRDGAVNVDENSTQYSQFPTNRFAPVNSHFGGGTAHSVQHDGLCFSIRLPSTAQAPNDGVSSELTLQQIALSLRGVLKGLTLTDPDQPYDGGDDDWTQTGDGHGGPGEDDNLGKSRFINNYIPSSSTYALTAQLYNNSYDPSTGSLNMYKGTQTLNLGLCYADIFANLFTGNRKQFFKTTATGTNLAQKIIFAATMGKNYKPSVGTGFNEGHFYADNICKVDNSPKTTEENLGVVVPFYTNANNNSYEIPGSLKPLQNSDLYVGNATIKALPFYYHLDFPVVSDGDKYVQLTEKGKQLRAINNITEFQPTGQGVSDFVNSVSYQKQDSRFVSNKLPTYQSTQNFDAAFHGATSPQFVNLDPNSTYTIDNTHAPGYINSISQHSVGFNKETRQPWGKVNVDISNLTEFGNTMRSRDDGQTYDIDLWSYQAAKLNNINAGNVLDITFLGSQGNAALRFTHVKGVSLDNIATKGLVNGVVTNFFTPASAHVASSQFQTNLTNGLTTSSSLGFSSDTFEIYDFKYKPGRYLADNSLYPINNDDITTINSDIDGPALTGQTAQELEREALQITTIALEGVTPENDRPYIDVDVEDELSEGWNNINPIGIQYNAASQITILKKTELIDHIGGVVTDADVNSLAWEQRFDFVVPGLTDYEGGYEEEEKLGCIDAFAENFNPDATINDGSCIYCEPKDLHIVDIHTFIHKGITAEILDAPAFGTGAAYGIELSPPTSFAWRFGNPGNAVNYSDPSLGLSIDNPAATAPYTSFQFELALSSSSVINAAQNAGSTVGVDAWQEYWINNITADSFSLIIYDIDYFDEDNFQWSGQMASPTASTTYTELPILDDTAPSIITLNNLGTTQLLQFGTENFPEDIGNISLGLEAGKHYLAVLKVEPRCGTDYYLAYNFWVLYCDCNIESAENFGGNNWTYPWSNTNAFPGGWGGGAGNPYRFCTSNPKTSRVWKRTKTTDEQEGLCIIPPEYVDCNTFIDWCVVGDTFECELTGNIVDGFVNIGSGTLSINIFGVYTGSDAGGSEYALYVAGQLFQFSIDLIDAMTNEIIETIVVNSIDDYLAYSGGITPQNMQFIQIMFVDVPQGTYNVSLTQLGNLFPTQDPEAGPCVNISTSVGSNQITIGGDSICENDIICDCNDEEAVNYNPDATFIVNGQPFNECNDQCIYEDCDDIFTQVLITAGTISNSVAECGEEQIDLDGDGDLDTSYYLLDTASGGAAFTINNSENVNFNIGIVSLINGNQSVGTQILFQYYTQNYEAITSAAANTASTITQGSTVVGAFLGLNTTTIPAGVFSANGLYAGNFLAFAIPQSTAVDPDNNVATCENELLEIIDNFFNFQVLLDTSGVTDCNEGCNEVTNPEDCDDYVAGCTDESASNYNPLANYDSGDCEYGGSEDCVTTPDLPECEECEGTSDSPEGGLRNCDEENGNEAGCGDPLACNYNPDANLWYESLCEYCCEGDEDCVESGDDDECEDEFGNVDPDCITSECPDQSNPDCDQPPVNPCPTPADCPEPPIPDCIQLGNCDDDGGGGDDPTVVIDDVITEEISCDPLFNGVKFSEWQIQAMSCSADEGTKMLFKLRSGVKQNSSDMIKLTLINYLFNQGLDLTCMYSCDDETKTTRNERGLRDCAANWKLNGAPTWTPKSTYKRGEIVRIIRNVRGVTRASYHLAKKDIPAQQISPTSKITNNSFWSRCITRKGQEPAIKGVSYLKTLYEFMIKHCQNCSIGRPGSNTNSISADTNIYPSGTDTSDSTKSIKSVPLRTDDNEITF